MFYLFESICVFIVYLYAPAGSDSLGPFWEFIRDVINRPSSAQTQCHAPKPILLNTGELDTPYEWQPKILPLQLLRVGQLVIVAVPAEFT